MGQPRQPLGGAAADRPRWGTVLLALGVLLGGGAVAEVAFDRYGMDIGTKRETVLTGSFLPGPFANIALVGAVERGNRRLRMFALADGAWQPAVDATLPADTLFVAVVEGSRSGAVDRLLTYQHGRLNWFDAKAKTERLLVPLTIRYHANEGGGVPAIDIAEDRNGDGRDDLLLPDVDGFWISTQAVDGTFAAPVKVGPPEPYLGEVAIGESRPYGESGVNATTLPWYLSRVHQADFNRDGRPDLVFWTGEHFAVHLQNERGQFPPVAKTFRVDAPFDVDGTYALMFEYNDENTLGLILGLRRKTQITMLHTLRDMNGDGVADLTTLSLEGRSLANHRGVYRLHFGTATPQGLAFATDADVTIRPRGKAGALQASGYSSVLMRDFDADGDTDILFRDVSVGLGGMMRAMAGKSIALNVELYRMDEGGFPRRATVRRKIRPRLYPIGSGVFFPPVLIGDLNGDGRLDLVEGKSRKELRIFAGVDGPDAFARRPQKVAVELPDDERNTRLVDLNHDGKQDVLIYDTRAQPHTVTTLIVR